MTHQQAVYRRVAAHPDYRRLRAEADTAHAQWSASTTYEDAVEAYTVMAQANAVITGIYDTVIAEMKAEKIP